jgi:hypothetical protein
VDRSDEIKKEEVPEQVTTFPPDSCVPGLRVLAKIITRKRLKEMTAGGGNRENGLVMNTPLMHSTTILITGKKKKEW